MPVSLSLSKPQKGSKKRVFYQKSAGTKASLKPKKTRSKKNLFTSSSRSKKPLAPSSIPNTPTYSFSDSKPQTKSLESSPPSISKNPPSFTYNSPDSSDQASPTIFPASSEETPSDYLSSPSTSSSISSSSEPEIIQLKQLIEQTTNRLSQLEHAKATQAAEIEPEVKDPLEFNGLDSQDEEIELVQEQLKKFQRENTKLQHQLEQINTDFQKEKKHLEETIKNLKAEVHRSVPLQDTKFLSLSKELHQAVAAIEKLSTDPTDPTNLDNSTSPSMQTPDPLPSSEPKPSTPTKSITVSSEPKKKASDTNHKKIAAAGGAAAIILTLGGLTTYQFTKTPQVNQELVDSYIKSGQVQGVQSDLSPPKQQGDKNLDLPFDQTSWAQFDDPILGFRISYPIDLVEKLHTGSSITFLRKQGFLLKIQKSNSTSSLQDFWETQKDTGLSYDTQPTKLRSYDALHLILLDSSDYPGNRYLVKNQDSIYDIWYATQSDKFPPDDFKRVQKMLDSFAFTI